MYEFYAEQLLDIPLEEAWMFFTSPANLAIITPPDLDFKIISRFDVPVYQGMEVSYTVKPLLGIQVKWKTLISEVVEGRQFTDRQLEGPYSLWEHTHSFTETEKGLLMTDWVKYSLPLGILGRFAHWLIVRKRIEEIFSFRKKTLNKLFNQHAVLID